jgi:hypothetical protein
MRRGATGLLLGQPRAQRGRQRGCPEGKIQALATRFGEGRRRGLSLSCLRHRSTSRLGVGTGQRVRPWPSLPNASRLSAPPAFLFFVPEQRSTTGFERSAATAMLADSAAAGGAPADSPLTLFGSHLGAVDAAASVSGPQRGSTSGLGGSFIKGNDSWDLRNGRRDFPALANARGEWVAGRGGAAVLLSQAAGAGRAGSGRHWQLRALAGLRQSLQWERQRRAPLLFWHSPSCAARWPAYASCWQWRLQQRMRRRRRRRGGARSGLREDGSGRTLPRASLRPRH